MPSGELLPKSRKMFRSGITGALFVLKSMETPERVYDDVCDTDIKDVWLTTYVAYTNNGWARSIARMKADEALEDYLEKFDANV